MSPNSGADAVLFLADAVAAVGLTLTSEGGANHTTDAYLQTPDGRRIAIDVKRIALVASQDLDRQIENWKREASAASSLRVIVADRVTHDSRRLLRAADISWLDLRGHLHLSGDGLFIDADVEPVKRRQPTEPFAGVVGIEVATAILLDPEREVAVRPIARSIQRAPSSVSAVIAGLKRADLVHDDGSVAKAALFSELASVWRTRDEDVASLPQPGDAAVVDALQVGFDDIPTTVGWAMSDAWAAVAYGAPIAIRSDHPRDFYVPDDRVLRRAVHLLGPSRQSQNRAATLRVTPVKAVCAGRVDGAKAFRSNEHWPLAHPLFVALDLAQDPGRGREALDQWTPPIGWHRVW